MHFKYLKHRRSFLLLEALLAVAMIGLCSSYLISTPMKVYQNHLEDLKKIELGRIADTLFIQIQYELKNKHPWNSLKEEPSHIYPLASLSLKISSIVHTTYQCGYTLRVTKTKEGPNDTLYKLVECVVYLTPTDGSWDLSSSHLFKFPYLIFTSATPIRKFL